MSKNKITILPNFLIVGAAKCGTTSLYYYLKQHPDIFMSTPKEPDFFFAQFNKIPTNGMGDDCQDVVPREADYFRLFEQANGRKAVGEASHTNLYYYPKTIPLIKQYLGNPKIIIILRNPVERAFASHTALTMQGREFLSFEDAFIQEPQRIADGWRSIWFYRDVGFYVHQVKAYLDHFSQVKVCLHEDLRREPASLIQELFRYLEVDEAFRPDTTADYNVSGTLRWSPLKRLFSRRPPMQRVVRYAGEAIFTKDGWPGVREKLKGRLLVKSGMKPEMRRELTNLYRNEIEQLQILIHRDLTSWIRPIGD